MGCLNTRCQPQLGEWPELAEKDSQEQSAKNNQATTIRQDLATAPSRTGIVDPWRC